MVSGANIIEILNNSKSVNYCKYKSLKLPLFPVIFITFVARLLRDVATIVNICKYGNGKRTYQAATA